MCWTAGWACIFYGYKSLLFYGCNNFSVSFCTGCLKIDATHQYDNSYCIKSSFIWVLKINDITSEKSNQMTKSEIDWLYPTVHVKEQFLGNIFGRTFSDSFLHNLSLHPHCQNILLSTSCQIWDFLPSCWGCLLTKIFFPPLSKTLWSRINRYYNILFSNLKLKRTQHCY